MPDRICKSPRSAGERRLAVIQLTKMRRASLKYRFFALNAICAGLTLAGCTALYPKQTSVMGTEQLLLYLDSERDMGKVRVAETLGTRLLTNDQGPNDRGWGADAT